MVADQILSAEKTQQNCIEEKQKLDRQKILLEIPQRNPVILVFVQCVYKSLYLGISHR